MFTLIHSTNLRPPRHLLDQVVGLVIKVNTLLEPGSRQSLLEDLFLGSLDLLLGKLQVEFLF